MFLELILRRRQQILILLCKVMKIVRQASKPLLQYIWMNKKLIALPLSILPVLGYVWHRYKGSTSTQKKQKSLYVGIELGGTNYSVAIAEPITNNNGEIIDFRILKRKNGNTYLDPRQSLAEIVEFIQGTKQSFIQHQQKNISFIGIASFGPLCLDKQNDHFGQITTTPKELWSGRNVLKILTNPFPETLAAIDTDVNAAAYAEYRLGHHAVKQSLVYITVGTGVGVGVIANGKTIHGLTHPEGGHVIAQRHPEEYQSFKGVCPFHKEQTCVEGMVCNKSIAERLNVEFTALAEVSEDARVWKLVGYYLAQLCLNITLLLSPEVIVIGGGIMNRTIIYNFIHKQFIRMLAGYVEHPLLARGGIEKYIVVPKLGSDVGVKGAMALSLM